MSRRSPDGGVDGGNDAGDADDLGGAEGSGIRLGGDVNGGEHEDVYGDGPLQWLNPCVRVGAQNMKESGEVVPDHVLNSLKIVRLSSSPHLLPL